MSFFALLAALLLEYFRPLPARLRAHPWFATYAAHLERQFNAGDGRHGVLAWLAAVLPFALGAALAGHWLAALHPLLGWAWSAAVLFFVGGCRDFAVRAANIASLLRTREDDEARRQLGEWAARDASPLSVSQVARLAIEETLAAAYRHLFGVVIWFVLAGPGGATLYRLAQLLEDRWGAAEGEFGAFAARAFGWLEWLPIRLTAVSFAVMGDFEDAMYCWRSQAAQWLHPRYGVVLASGAGALGVRLGEPLPVAGGMEFRPELGLGDEPDADDLDSAASLVWRVLVLWLALLLLVTLARWTGG